MSDIVGRLRRQADRFGAMDANAERPWVADAAWAAESFNEAADEIERLRTEVNQLSTSCGHCGDLERAWAEAERLRAALRRIAHSADYDTIISPDGDRHQRAIEIALETLAGSER